jgi:serine/arginine repetitive matrix protein 2
MATKTQTSPSLFPRIRFGFGPKSSRMRLPPDPQQNPDDADWYLPYNGPYELPPPVSRSQNRDSWGHVVGSVLGDLGSTATSPTDRAQAGGRFAFPLPSSGAYSSHPYRASTATTDGARPTPIITSSTAFAHIDTTGGVGESPAPMGRSPLQTSSLSGGGANRLSLANLLSFGASTRKSRSDSLHSSQRPLTKRSRNGTPTPPDPLQSNHLPPRSNSLAHVGPSNTHHAPRQRSNTLIGTYKSPPAPAPASRKPSTSSQHRDSPLSAHPYAYAQPFSFWSSPTRANHFTPPSHSVTLLRQG